MLARNVVKLVVERRRGLPFARFRAKLVAALLGLTIVPAVLVLLVGSELIRQTTARWFSQPVDRRPVVGERDRRRLLPRARGGGRRRRPRGSPRRSRRRRSLSGRPRRAEGRRCPRRVIDGRVGMVEVYRLQPAAAGTADVVPVVALQSPSLPPGHLRASSDRLAREDRRRQHRHAGARAARRRRRAGARRRRSSATPAGTPIGVVIASDFLSGDLAQHARRIAEAYEDYSQLRVLKRPLEGVYLSFFLM